MVGATILVAMLSAPAVPAKTDDIDLDALLKLYMSYGLPLPPRDAVPVVFETGLRGGGLPSGKPAHLLVFKFTGEDGKARYMCGAIDDWKPYRQAETELSFDDPDVRVLFRSQFWYSDERGTRQVGQDDMLATGIQAYSLGHKELAQFLVGSKYGGVFAGASWSSVPREATPELRVTYLALHDALNDWFDVGQDRIEISGRILRIVVDEKKIVTPFSGINEFRDEFIKDLMQTVALLPIPDDEVERLIENLLSEGGHMTISQKPEYSEAMKRILERGVDALPALKRHIEDERLTRYSISQMNNSSGEPLRLSSVIASLISHITNGDVAVRPETGYERLVDAWIRSREEDDKRIFFRVAMEFHDHSARRGVQREYVTKFPQDFKATYMRLVGQGQYSTFGMADVVVEGEFTDDEKVAMLRLFGEKGPLGGARYAMRILPSVSIDHARSVFVSWFDKAFDGPPDEQKRWDAGDAAYFMDRYADDALWARFGENYREADAPVQIDALMGIATRRRFGLDGQEQAIELLIDRIRDETPAPDQDERKIWHQWFGGPYEGQTMGDAVTVMLFKSLVDASRRSPNVPTDSKGVERLREQLVTKLKELGYKVDGGQSSCIPNIRNRNATSLVPS
ncbi:MAG: hypothetical protein IH944_09860 [Armatimonadetes bacterium]|nr:hypothetical protein [Armatimonadota bacterium]